MNESDLGLEFHWRSFQIFFGKEESQLTWLQSAFPKVRFLRLKQTHSNLIHEVSSTTPDFTWEGDGLISDEENLALCSISADCVPVLMASPDSGWFGAFHAGWRGVASRIIPRGVESLLRKGSDPEQLRIWIGPHILQDSFEVQADVRDQILMSLPPVDLKEGTPVSEWTAGSVTPQNSTLFYYESSGKFHVSLIQVLLEQIAAVGVPLDNIEMELDDTKTNLEFHSARRDQAKSGRQISWIAEVLHY